jgi:hypothetical protein
VIDTRPGLNAARLLDLSKRAIERCSLDLDGAVVLTEAASGSYAVTPILAAMAGARVYARGRDTRYGSFAHVAEFTSRLAAMGGVAARISLHDEIPAGAVEEADIITNSGHIRPLDAQMIGRMKATAVIPLMYEGWEFRRGDVDLAACAKRGIPVAGTNERHPAIDVFSYLGVMAVKLLLDAGIEVYSTRLLVLCGNHFAPFIEAGLRRAGAEVDVVAELPAEVPAGYDAVLIAQKSGAEKPLSAAQIAKLGTGQAPPVLAQYWGDLDRAAAERAGLSCWPPEAPAPGHMGVLPSAVGPDPIVRLQAGGLKAGEVLWRERRRGATAAASLSALLASGYGDLVVDAAARHATA